MNPLRFLRLGLVQGMLGILCSAPAWADTGPTEVVAAASPVETRYNRRLAPSSSLPSFSAEQLAGRLSSELGRNIVIARVRPTGSMRPYFNENALLLLEAAPFESLRLGDVVTFVNERTGDLIVHRLVEKKGGVFWSRGDHNSRMDQIYVTPQNYRRRLVGVVYMEPQAHATTGAASAQRTGSAD